jgi:hypothetical protein
VTVQGLLADCRACGVDLAADGARLRWRSQSAPPRGLLARLRDHKAEVLVALRSAQCPKCGQPTDDHRRCWQCCDRPCDDCGRPTGSALIRRCCACGSRFNGNTGGWAGD